MSETTSDDRNLATITHLSGIIASIVMPLIVWLINKDNANKSYLNTQSKEALNFQITVLIAYVIAGVLSVIGIGLLLMPLIWLANLVLCILAAVKASNGEDYRYPFALRLIS